MISQVLGGDEGKDDDEEFVVVDHPQPEPTPEVVVSSEPFNAECKAIYNSVQWRDVTKISTEERDGKLSRVFYAVSMAFREEVKGIQVPSYKDFGPTAVLQVMEQQLLQESEIYKTAMGTASLNLRKFIDLCKVTHVNLKALIEGYKLWLGAGNLNVPAIVQYVEIDSDSHQDKLTKLRTAIMTNYFVHQIQMRHRSDITKTLIKLETQFEQLRWKKLDLQGYPNNVVGAVNWVYEVSANN